MNWPSNKQTERRTYGSYTLESAMIFPNSTNDMRILEETVICYFGVKNRKAFLYSRCLSPYCNNGKEYSEKVSEKEDVKFVLLGYLLFYLQFMQIKYCVNKIYMHPSVSHVIMYCVHIFIFSY